MNWWASTAGACSYLVFQRSPSLNSQHCGVHTQFGYPFFRFRGVQRRGHEVQINRVCQKLKHGLMGATLLLALVANCAIICLAYCTHSHVFAWWGYVFMVAFHAVWGSQESANTVNLEINVWLKNVLDKIKSKMQNAIKQMWWEHR